MRRPVVASNVPKDSRNTPGRSHDRPDRADRHYRGDGVVRGGVGLYLRRVRQGRADPVVDPSWPSNLRPMPRHLHDPADVAAETSLYFDPNEAKLSRRDPEAD